MAELRSALEPRTTGVLLAALLLCSCAVELVSPYDEVIDSGLMTFNEDFLQFMARIEQNVPSEDASYASNTGFYNAQEAVIATLVQRAQASDPNGSCPGTQLAIDKVQQVDSIVLPESAADGGAAPPRTGSCTMILLEEIQQQLLDTACFHQAIYGGTSSACEARGFTTSIARSLESAPPATKQMLLGQVESAVTASVTAALTFELAKKPSTS